jgi:hypothetical protein
VTGHTELHIGISLAPWSTTATAATTTITTTNTNTNT